MTHDRGEYRAIRRVLLDGPDFQKLSERARWVFVVLKINLGPSGIDVFYPTALVHQVAAQTGALPAEVTTALDTLEEAGWIVREANVLWVVGQLEHDPHIQASDPKHRKAIVRHLAGLPRLEIIRAFVGANGEFFPATDEASQPLAWAIEGPSKGHRSTDNKREYKNKKEIAPVGANWVSRIALFWTAEVGRLDHGRLGADAKPFVDKHGAEMVERAARLYVTTQKAAGKQCKWPWFLDEIGVYIQRLGTIAVVDGEMTPELERLTRPA